MKIPTPVVKNTTSVVEELNQCEIGRFRTPNAEPGVSWPRRNREISHSVTRSPTSPDLREFGRFRTPNAEPDVS